MKLTTLVLPALALAAHYSADEYNKGAVHARLMAIKEQSFSQHRSKGDHDSRKWNSWKGWKKGNWRNRNDRIQCKNGLAIVEPGNANQTFRCKNMDMYDFMSHADLGSTMGEGSSSWGWVSRSGREFAAIGQADGTAFIEISKKGKIVYLGRLPQQSVPSIWREIRVWDDYVIIGSEARDHGVQIFDMKKLLNINPARPKTFSTTKDLTGLFDELPIGRTHNIVINWDLDYAIAVGAQPRNSTCKSGLTFIDLTDPSTPSSPGCASSDGYVHDAQCVKYNGPDKRYVGHDICIGYNEDTMTIYDVGDKSGTNASKVLSRTPYDGATYTHQGWFIQENWHQYILLDDELDERDKVGPAASQVPVTYIMDVTDLEHPVNTGHFHSSDVRSIDHNLYVHDGLSYHSNYGSGIRVHDVSVIPEDPTGKSVEEIGFFDIYPEDDGAEGGGLAEFHGTWSHYTFPSGYILVNTIERGSFVVKLNKFSGRGWGKRRG